MTYDIIMTVEVGVVVVVVVSHGRIILASISSLSSIVQNS